MDKLTGHPSPTWSESKVCLLNWYKTLTFFKPFFAFCKKGFWRVVLNVFLVNLYFYSLGVFCFGVGGWDAYAIKTINTQLICLTNRENVPNLSRSHHKDALRLTVDSSKSWSSFKDLSFPMPERRWNMVLGRSLSLRVNTRNGYSN